MHCHRNLENGEPNRSYFSRPYSRFEPEGICGPPVLIGARTVICPAVRLYGPIVLGDDVYVDKGVFLFACIVLPGTYVPAGTELRNAVVSSEVAVDLDGTVISRFDEWQTRRDAMMN